MSRWTLKVVDLVGGVMVAPHYPPGTEAFVRGYDPDANAGLGLVELTTEIEEAVTFDSVKEALAYWQKPSLTRPYRPDGKPNRPLTAFSVAIHPVGEER